MGLVSYITGKDVTQQIYLMKRMIEKNNLGPVSGFENYSNRLLFSMLHDKIYRLYQGVFAGMAVYHCATGDYYNLLADSCCFGASLLISLKADMDREETLNRIFLIAKERERNNLSGTSVI